MQAEDPRNNNFFYLFLMNESLLTMDPCANALDHVSPSISLALWPVGSLGASTPWSVLAGSCCWIYFRSGVLLLASWLPLFASGSDFQHFSRGRDTLNWFRCLAARQFRQLKNGTEYEQSNIHIKDRTRSYVSSICFTGKPMRLCSIHEPCSVVRYFRGLIKETWPHGTMGECPRWKKKSLPRLSCIWISSN